MTDLAHIARWKRWLANPNDPKVIAEREAYLAQQQKERAAESAEARAEYERTHPIPKPPEPTPTRKTVDAWKEAMRARDPRR